MGVGVGVVHGRITDNVVYSGSGVPPSLRMVTGVHTLSNVVYSRSGLKWAFGPVTSQFGGGSGSLERFLPPVTAR